MALIAKSKCRSLMIFNKQFLAELYESNKLTSRKILLIASDSQIKLLLHLLHFIATGEIPLSQESHDSISKAKKARFILTKFKEKAKVKRLLKLERKEQLQLLLKLSSLYKFLLLRLFDLTGDKEE